MKKLITITSGSFSTLLKLQFLFSKPAHELWRKLINIPFRTNNMKNKISLILFILCFNFLYDDSRSDQGYHLSLYEVGVDPEECGFLQLGFQYGLPNCGVYFELYDLVTNQPAFFYWNSCNQGLPIGGSGTSEPYCLRVQPGRWRVTATAQFNFVIYAQDEIVVEFDPGFPNVGTAVEVYDVRCRSCNDGAIVAEIGVDPCHMWKAMLYRDLDFWESQLFEPPYDFVRFLNLRPAKYRVDFMFWHNNVWNLRESHYVTIKKPKLAPLKPKLQGHRGPSPNLAFGISGDNNPNVNDTVLVYLRNVNPPYDIVDTAKTALDSTGNGDFNFYNADVGIPYYIVVKHRNTLETWSSSGQVFGSDSLMNYDFSTSASQAYGNNMILIDGEYYFYSGDVNQDGAIDLWDVTSVYNDASTFVTGYVATDLTGDDIVDLDDMLIVYENSIRFVAVRRP